MYYNFMTVHREAADNSQGKIENSERQLWALIHFKGPLHSDVLVLYRNIRSSYERAILSNHTHSELQEVEYCLWKLHYKHIDEFRKIIKKCSGNAENKKSGMLQDGVVQINNDHNVQAFNSFLSKATEFYQTLIVKVRKHYGVQEEALFYNKGIYNNMRTLILKSIIGQLLPHITWKQQGFGQILAVLATYVGDDFLALYHCVRSLAVKEPFPDAWDNLILLCLEEFPIALASTVGVLDEMMELEDIKLKTMLESYGQMDLARKGPFRALQMVSMLIFTLKNLIDKHQTSESKDSSDCHQLVLIQLALAAAFVVVGRFIERCLKSSPLNYCPLLPSVLVFVEWCASMLDAIEVFLTDPKSATSISYFFDVLIELLNKVNENNKETKKLVDSSPLWEDYELRGFVLVSFSHDLFDFSSGWEHIDNFESGTELRTQRITEAAMKIANKYGDLNKWIICDELERKFYSARSDESHEKKETDLESLNKKKSGDDLNPSSVSINEKSYVVEEEEEEVILFRPLARYNSAPPYVILSLAEQMSSTKVKEDKVLTSDDCLCRTTSLPMAQNPFQIDSWGFQGDILNSTMNESFQLQEPSLKGSNSHRFSEGPISAGHPSLNAWVLDRGGLSNKLHPIEELASTCLVDLSINRTQNSLISSVEEFPTFLPSSATYTTPIPSAPLFPDNATWYTNVTVQSSMPAPLLPDNALPINGYAAWSSIHGSIHYDTSFPSYSNGYPPPPGNNTSEWLHWYRENPSPEWVNNQTQLAHLNVPRNHESFLHHDAHKLNQFDQWGNHLSSNQYPYMKPLGPLPLQPSYPYAFGAGEHLIDLFHNFQRPIPYGCGYVTEQINESLPLLEYLKEKECRLQHDPTLKGPTFMGN
ncbi:unnamed protein product [Sphenostylis stenocarpa]|uniref:Protein SMG7L n=1 Tax=Sphenostylis stenocarpa TaxID=92480 RepID=A0AA86SPD8_9FABA|nr:unnamed protein product [Sphenostylis stenocarpa]